VAFTRTPISKNTAAVVAELIDQTVTRFPAYARHRINIAPLEKGGSDRFFYRMQLGDELSLILAKYGSLREENRHYVGIATFLRGLGVRVPEIYFHDEGQGLIWMEDLGDRDLWSFRGEPWLVRRPLYLDALDQILTLHQRAHEAPAPEPSPFQPGFDAALYRWEQNYFLENCLGQHFGLDADDVERHCDHARLEEIAEALAERPQCFVHRDFQSQNIVVKGDEACFIDFQGMRLGLPHYDLASLLYDPYVNLPGTERRELLAYYVGACERQGRPLDGDFEEVFALCAMQRLMQALGAYGFLGHIKGRAHFLAHIEPALSSLRKVLSGVRGMDGLGKLLRELPPSQPTSVAR
jgi:N-acetylmuramate 1-kinase